MQVIKAVYDGINFTPKQPIPVQEQYEVVITFVEQIFMNPITDIKKQVNRDINFWKEFDKLTADAADEILLLEDFPRSNFKRELIVFDDEV